MTIQNCQETQTLNQCLNKLLYEKQNLVDSLNVYKQEWINYLVDIQEPFDYKQFFQEIQKQCTEVLSKIHNDFSKYKEILEEKEQQQLENHMIEVKQQILSKLNEILIILKEKESEISLFTSNVDLHKILTEDSIFLKKKEREDICEKIKMKLLDCSIPEWNDAFDSLSLDKQYTFINNHFYYLYKCIKVFEQIIELSTKCEWNVDSKILVFFRVLLFFSMSLKSPSHQEKQDLVYYFLDNMEEYKNQLNTLNILKTSIETNLECPQNL